MDEDKENCFGIGDEIILGAVLAGFSAGAMCACGLGRGARKRKRASDVDDLVPPDGEVLNPKPKGTELCRQYLYHVDKALFREDFRMEQITFVKLLAFLKEKGLRDNPQVSACEKLMMGLYVLGTPNLQGSAASKFFRSKRTAHRAFHEFLDVLVNNCKLLVRPERRAEHQHAYISEDVRFARYFGDCIGAMDGTHVDVNLERIPMDERERYKNRHHKYSQNVLAIVNWDRTFAFVYAGFEGSAHDGRVFHHAMQHHAFPIYPGKYYLADKAFKLCETTLSPYRGVEYYLRRGQVGNLFQLFNHVHSCGRNIVERVFGILKARFPILKRMRRYPYETQVLIVIACVYLHNFITLVDEYDDGSWIDYTFEINNHDDDDDDDDDDEDEDDDNEPVHGAQARGHGHGLGHRNEGAFGVGDGVGGGAGLDGAPDEAGEAGDAGEDGEDEEVVEEEVSDAEDEATQQQHEEAAYEELAAQALRQDEAIHRRGHIAIQMWTDHVAYVNANLHRRQNH
jgi:hypothetical protein